MVDWLILAHLRCFSVMFLLSLHLVTVKHAHHSDSLCSEAYDTPSHQVCPLPFIIINGSEPQYGVKPQALNGWQTGQSYEGCNVEKIHCWTHPTTLFTCLSLSSTITTFSSVKSHFWGGDAYRVSILKKCAHKQMCNLILEQRYILYKLRWYR